MYDDDDDDDVTVFEPAPWGAKQRVLPRRTFKAAISRIITLVPSLVRPIPPPIPTRRAPNRISEIVAAEPVPALVARAITAPVLAAPALAAPASAFVPPAFAIPTLAEYSARLGPLAIGSRAHLVQTWPIKRVRALPLKRVAAGLLGAVLVLIAAVVVRAIQHTPPQRSHVGASLAISLTAEPQDVDLDDAAAAPAPQTEITVTPIEPLVEPTVAKVLHDDETAPQPIAKKRTRKKPRRIVAGDTSTPLGNLRPSPMLASRR
jgi:hypothetical protein